MSLEVKKAYYFVLLTFLRIRKTNKNGTAHLRPVLRRFGAFCGSSLPFAASATRFEALGLPGAGSAGSAAAFDERVLRRVDEPTSDASGCCPFLPPFFFAWAAGLSVLPASFVAPLVEGGSKSGVVATGVVGSGDGALATSVCVTSGVFAGSMRAIGILGTSIFPAAVRMPYCAGPSCTVGGSGTSTVR